jgi:hypothetical protein
VLVEMNRSVAVDCLRRPLRLFQRVDDKGSGPSENEGRSGPGGGANTNKEPVVEAMNRKQFMECLHVINPAISTQEVSGGLLAACFTERAVCHALTLKFNHFQHMYDRAGTGHVPAGPGHRPRERAALPGAHVDEVRRRRLALQPHYR